MAMCLFITDWMNRPVRKFSKLSKNITSFASHSFKRGQSSLPKFPTFGSLHLWITHKVSKQKTAPECKKKINKSMMTLNGLIICLEQIEQKVHSSILCLMFSPSLCSPWWGGWRSTSLSDQGGGNRIWRHQIRLQNRFCKFLAHPKYFFKLNFFLLLHYVWDFCLCFVVLWWKHVFWKQSPIKRNSPEWKWRPNSKVNRDQMETRKGVNDWLMLINTL